MQERQAAPGKVPFLDSKGADEGDGHGQGCYAKCIGKRRLMAGTASILGVACIEGSGCISPCTAWHMEEHIGGAGLSCSGLLPCSQPSSTERSKQLAKTFG